MIRMILLFTVSPLDHTWWFMLMRWLRMAVGLTWKTSLRDLGVWATAISLEAEGRRRSRRKLEIQPRGEWFNQWCLHKKALLQIMDIKSWRRASLVVQWLRIHLAMLGSPVWSLVQEDPTCCGAVKPMHHTCWACALEPASHNYGVRAEQLHKTSCPRACAPQERPSQWEACSLQPERSPHSPQLKRAHTQ